MKHKPQPLLLLTQAFALGALMMSCAPANQVRVPKADYLFTPLAATAVSTLAQPFKSNLERVGITLEEGQAFGYEGDDERAFYAAVDKFYLEHPGFCPVENAFLNAANSLYLTVAARPAARPGDPGTVGEVWAFVYDQSRKPKLTFAFVKGSSSRAIAGTPCRVTAP